MGKRVLVTGGRGFVGGHVVRELLAKEYSVRVVDKEPGSIWTGAMVANILDKERMDEIFKSVRPDYVIHLAANASLMKSKEDAVYDAENNIIGTINVLDLCKKYAVERIVFSSTGAVYADQNAVLPEEALKDPRSPYAVSKLACEYYIKASDTKYSILRYGNVYGPGQIPLGNNQVIPRYIRHLLYDVPFVLNGDGLQERDFVYVEDVARATVAALAPAYPSGSELSLLTANVTSGIGTSILAVLQMIKKCVDGPEREIVSAPSVPGEARRIILSPAKAYTFLKWESSVPLEDGIERTVTWWKRKLK